MMNYFEVMGIAVPVITLLAIYAFNYWISYDSNRRAMSQALGEYFKKRGE